MPSPREVPPPDAAALHQAALSYLARYAATQAGLRRVLIKRVDRWARTQPDQDAAAATITTARALIDDLIARLVKAGAVSDAAFAEGRTRSLVRSGRSRRAIQARLLAKGVAPDLARQATGDDAATELAAALILLRRRRLGAFRTSAPADAPATHNRELGILARAGFPREVAEQALAMDIDQAEQRIHALRADQHPGTPD